MLAYINGLVISKSEKTMVVLAQNLGYKIHVTTNCLADTKADQKVQLHLYTAVREDDLSLYGFQKKEELEFFEQLISVSGIGPKMAMDILSSPIDLIKNAIVGSDTAVLTKVKGLGKKTAERLVLELKNKVTPSTLTDSSTLNPATNEEAVMALVGLGYEKYEVIKRLSVMPEDIQETEEIVRYFFEASIRLILVYFSREKRYNFGN